MSFLLVLSIMAIVLVVLVDLFAWQILLHTKDTPEAPLEILAAVAILLPVRNEAQHLAACLQSLLALDYPADKLYILVGNDASTDDTLAIARHWQQQHPYIQVVDITENLGLARGKANVLAQLVHHCPAEVTYFFMTDADIRPHPRWIYRMLQAMQPEGVGLVNGTTTVTGGSLWARWQQTEWAVALGLAKAYTYLPRVGRTLTAIGNNMVISREAYQATGGYEQIPFSITEDYELMHQAKLRGYGVRQLMDGASSAFTEPVEGFGALLHQRKRWMTGAMRLPLLMIILLLLQALFFPAIAVVLGLQPLMGLVLLLLKLLLQFLLVRQVFTRLGIDQWPASGILYELYNFMMHAALLFFYVLPFKINWKGRQYQNNRS